MRVTISISHTEAEDLTEVEAAARRLGLSLTTRGAFLGRCHTELSATMTPSALADLLSVDGDASVAA